MRAHLLSAHKMRPIAAIAVWGSALMSAPGMIITKAMAACSGSGVATWTVACSGTDTNGYSASKLVNSRITIAADAVVNNLSGGDGGVSMTTLGSVTITNLGQISLVAGPGVAAIGATGVTINGAGGSITTASNKGPGIFGLSAVGNVTITDPGNVTSGTGSIDSSTVSTVLSGLSLPTVLSGGVVASAVAGNVRIGGSDGIAGTITTTGNFGILATAADVVTVNTKVGSVVTAASGAAITALAAVGNVSIKNGGALTGSGSNVTTAAVWGSSLTGNLSLTNSGSITTTRSNPAAGYAVTLVGLDLANPGSISITNSIGGSITGRLSLGSGDPSYSAASTTLTNAGTWTTSGASQFGANGVVTFSNSGTISTSGPTTFSMSSSVLAAVTNTGSFSTSGSLNFTGSPSFTNSAIGIVDISSGDLTGVGSFNNAATLASAGVRNLGAGTFNNHGTGVLTMRNLVSTDRLTLNGTYVGSPGSVIAIDVSMASGAPTGDNLTITGAGSSGSSIVTLKNLDATKGFFTTPLKLIEGSGAASFAAATDADTVATLAPGKMIGYSFQRISDGVWGIVSTLDLSAAGGPVAHTKSALTSLNTSFFQNVSSLLAAPVGAAADAGFGGLWILPAGGANQISYSSTSTFGAPARTTVGIKFAGFQVGADFGVANVSGSGLNLHLGVSAGQVDLSGSDRNVQSGASSTFSSPYFTTYLALQGNGFFADAQARRLNFDGAVYNAGVGFKAPIKSHVDTIALNAGYRLSDGVLFLEPSIGFSRTRHQGANVTVEDVGELRLANIRSDLGKVGARVGASLLINHEFQVDPYVSVNFWRELHRAAMTQFEALSGAIADVRTHTIQSFTQVSLGVDAKLTTTPVVAFLRADGRFSADIIGWSATGGVRVSF